MKKLFWIDNVRNREISYDQFIDELNNAKNINKFIQYDDPYLVFYNLILNLLHRENSVLLDADFSETELSNLGTARDRGSIIKLPTSFNIQDFEELLSIIEKESSEWTLEIYTSGTTGRPKSIKQSYQNLVRGVKKRASTSVHTWAFAYNPSHFAGLQVFFQAFLNRDEIIHVFETLPNLIADILKKRDVTHISCTPTFLRQFIYYVDAPITSLIQATFGGEKFDTRLQEKIKQNFPNAKIRNVYASTEAGSLFASEGEYFIISDRLKSLIKFSKDNELLIHKTLLGQSESIDNEGNWYNTGDLVEQTDDYKFKFVSRSTDMINVGGYKVNPSEVEEVIRSVAGVKDVMVSGKKNSVTGNIIVASIILSESTNEDEVKLNIKNRTKETLQEWKIPRKIKIVDNFEITRTGKLKRI